MVIALLVNPKLQCVIVLCYFTLPDIVSCLNLLDEYNIP